MKKKRLLILMALLPLVANAYNVEIDGICYNLSGNEAEVISSGYSEDGSKYSGAIVIPELVNYNGKTYTVTSIGNEAFSFCGDLTSVTIPGSVKTIKESAFWYSLNLENVELSMGLETICDGAFCVCAKVKSLNIPESVTEIGRSAFYGCWELSSINIPQNIKVINEGTFGDCYKLTDIVIPDGVTTIGMSAFENCGGLTSITIPASVTTIMNSAFNGCSGLTSINIPSNVTSIGENAFSFCKSLETIVVEQGNLHYDSRDNCNAIIETETNTLITGCKTSVIPNSVTSIGYCAFQYCTSLTSIEIPNSVTSIGEWAFYNCTGLTSVYSHIEEPFEIDNYVFWYSWGYSSHFTTATLYVPAGTIDAYKATGGWRNFKKIEEIEVEEDYSISISLPEGINTSDYSMMWLELTNTKSGQRIHYVMTDRTTYTFSGIASNTSWNVVLRNEHGDVFGQIDNIEVKDEDVNVTFSSLLKPQSVVLSVLTLEGKDVTTQTQITWTDVDGNYLAQGASLSGLPVGYQTTCRIVLPQDLAMTYLTPQPVDYVLTDGDNNIICQLDSIPQIQITGKVKDAVTGLPLSGAVVSASQTYAGKYHKTLNAKTDGNGVYTLEIANVPTSIAFAASDYISQTLVCDSLMTGETTVTLPDVSLKPITGATISIDFTYTSCNGETQNWYSDYQNVSYMLYNETKQCTISQFNVQYPQIVLLEDIDDGDVLRLTASSRTNAFMPVEATATIAEQKASATFDIVEFGKIQATFTTTGNSSVVGILYDASGKLVKTCNYSNASLTISELSDGQYTLISMGSSRLFNTIYDIAQLPQTGLAEGTDYVQNTIEVQSGVVSSITIDEVPTLDESKLYYTGDNTSFTVNKSSIVAGNYLTLTGHIDFKPEYATNVNNVQMIVDLPESCQFVENSVMVGSGTSSYILNGNRLTIPVMNYTDRVRLCIIPTLSGDYAPSAFVQFDFDGETITQPIGSANYTVKDLSINVPSTVAKTSVPISGTAIGKSTIEIYDGDVLIGQTTSLANGSWTTTCELNEPYNLSNHHINAIMISKNGLAIRSEAKDCFYNQDAVFTKSVTMSFYNGWLRRTIDIVFDFEKGKVSDNSYMFYRGTDITFIVNLSNNAPSEVSAVKVLIYTDKNELRELNTFYNENIERWIAVSHFESNNLPINVGTSVVANGKVHMDKEYFQLLADRIDYKTTEIKEIIDSINNMNSDIAIIEQDVEMKDYLLGNILQQIEETEDIEGNNSLLSEFLYQAGFGVGDNAFDIDDSVVIDKEYLQNLISKADELLNNPIEDYDDSVLEGLIREADLLLNEDNDEINYEASLETALSDSILIESEKGIATIIRTTLEELDRITFEVVDTVVMEMTDASCVYVYYSADDEIAIVDSIQNEVWLIRGSSIFEGLSQQKVKYKAPWDNLDFISAMNTARQNLSWLVNNIGNFVNNILSERNNIRRSLESSLNGLQNQQYVLLGENAGRNIRIREIQNEINRLMKPEIITLDDYFGIVERDRIIKQLKAEQIANLRKIRNNNYTIGTIRRNARLISRRIIAVGAVIGQIYELQNVIDGLHRTIDYIGYAVNDHNHWHSLINSIKPCPSNPDGAEWLMMNCKDDWTDIAWRKGYYPAFTTTGILTIINGYLMTNRTAKIVVQMLLSTITDFLNNTADAMFYQARNASKEWYQKRYDEYQKLKCSESETPDDQGSQDTNPNNPNGGNGQDDENGSGETKQTEPEKPDQNNDSRNLPCPPVSPIHDPSGFVYEGVASNRLQGVTATAYYKETIEDMYGDQHENIVKWDASEYAQENPLFTDEYGMYAWDVPQGLWQVKFEKEGYETTYSDWLPVPPPQLDVNIAMTQARQPEVKTAHAFEDAVEVEFDKYMMPELLNKENIKVMQNGISTEGSIELLNEETDEGGSKSYASKVRFNATQPFFEQEVTLMVSNRVQSYAGIKMQDNYQQTFFIEQEIKHIVCDSLITVGYGKTSPLVVSVLPASASRGKMLTVKTSSPMILSVETEQVVIDNDGKAEIALTGELPGTAALTFSVEGTDKTAMTIANVENIVYQTVATPTTNIASGSVVKEGTEIILSCATEGATIYYTLDGSCPCDKNGTRAVYDGTPIKITESITIKAMAVAPNMYDSEVAEFVYTVKGTGIEELSLDNEIQVYPLPVNDILNVTAGGKTIKSVTVSAMTGMTVTSVNKPATKVTLDLSKISTGIYIISVITEKGNYSRKILKVQ